MLVFRKSNDKKHGSIILPKTTQLFSVPEGSSASKVAWTIQKKQSSKISRGTAHNSRPWLASEVAWAMEEEEEEEEAARREEAARGEGGHEKSTVERYRARRYK
ncbi:hypothetical protein KM043_013759 [Ampulex compressa]|nr:hypothetical protein KM043_013759 [Ampulex compressa]